MQGRTDSGRRLLVLLVVFVLIAGALVLRLGYWQLGQREELVESARRQIYYRAEVPSRRGQIYDRSGTVVLAASVTRDRLIVSAQHMDAAERFGKRLRRNRVDRDRHQPLTQPLDFPKLPVAPARLD